ncbi:MAG: Ig-like domain repeat protein [Edaphobacter sp.]
MQADRVIASPDSRVTTRLAGHVPGWAVSANDRGAVASGTTLQLTFVLSRSSELQAGFTQLLADQQNPNSSSYHQWLTPQQVGERFGPTQHDVDALTGWLRSQGLQVMETAPSRVFVKATGTASAAANALATSFHTFSVNGQSRMSTTVDPSIPAAFASVVRSISGLSDPDLRPMIHGQAMAKPASIGTGDRPQYTSNSINGQHYITPGDFAVIFDVNSVYNSGSTGTGQKVAIIGRSQVASTDISEYESAMALPNNLPNTIIPATGADPGTTNDGDQGEATLDVERLIGTAPGVQADLVVSSSASGGIFTAAQYEVQTVLDPVMTISFGSCEFYAGAANVSLWDTLFSQAASEGISVFVSSGDAGAAGCDTQFAVPPVYQILSINYICASSYATCVGGTELSEGANVAQYWSATNGTGLVSALKYIPEGAWNEPLLGEGIGNVAASGGGGASIYIPKPTWQTGTGVPSDSARDVPDVSFPAAFHDAYYGCFAAAGGDCAANHFYFYYGTSAGTPSMAGVTALLNQKTGGSQGNLNPLLYRLAATNANAFHDATPGTIDSTLCAINTPSICNNSTPGSNTATSGLAGYALTAGYDQATGLGSLDVANFLAAAVAVPKSTLAPATLSVQESASTISNTQTVVLTATLTSKTAGAPTGTVQFYADGKAIGSPVAVASGTAVSAALALTAAGTYSISASYSGDGTYAATVSPGIPLTVTGLTSVTAVTVSNASIPVGTAESLSIAVSAGSGTAIPTGIVRVRIVGPNVAIQFSVPLLNGVATTPSLTFPVVGNYAVTASYFGDPVFSPSIGTGPAIVVQRLVPSFQLSVSSGTIGIGGGVSSGIFIGYGQGTAAPGPTGTIQLYSNGVALGSPFALPTALGQTAQGSSPVSIFSTAGMYTITATYSGDANWQPATSQGSSLTVESTPAFYQLSVSPTTRTLRAGDVENNEEFVDVASELGFVGTVNVSCSITYNGPGTVTGMPTCSLSPGSVTFPLVFPPGEPTLTINTTARPSSGLLADSRLQHRGWRGSGAVMFCALLLWLGPVRRRSWRALGILMVFAAGFTALSGCGGRYNASSTPAGTSAGSYTITITPSSTAVGVSVAPVTVALTIT